MKKSLLSVLAVSSLVVLGACAGDEAAEEAAIDTTAVEEMAPAPEPMPVDTMPVVVDTMAPDTTP